MVDWSIEDHFACNNYDPLLIISILKEHTWRKPPKTSQDTVNHPYRKRGNSEVFFIYETDAQLTLNMSTGLLGDFAVNVMRGCTILILKIDISDAYMRIDPHRMMVSSLFTDAWFMRYLYIFVIEFMICDV